MSLPAFASRVVRWQRRFGRHDLPWQATRDPYRVWLSEVMLQQTQVATVIPYYQRFLARFPTVSDLARATEDGVLSLWSGLGYYARGRNLLRAARLVVERHGGAFPTGFEDLVQLPGVGRSTAGAIASIAGGERRAILDGNVRRVLARHAGIEGAPASTATMNRLWAHAESLLPTQSIATGQLRHAGLRAAVRRKRVTMLVVVSRGEVLLEKRPPTGIWGGLWSLPEIDAEADPARALLSVWGLATASRQPLARFEHAFTHYTLEVTPWLIQPKRGSKIAANRQATWLPLSELPGAALPSPVRRLLKESLLQQELVEHG